MNNEKKFLESLTAEKQRLQEKLEFVNNAILQIHLRNLDLEPSIILNLKKANMNTIQDLIVKSEKELKPYISYLEIKLIKNWLSKYGLNLSKDS